MKYPAHRPRRKSPAVLMAILGIGLWVLGFIFIAFGFISLQ